MLWDILSCLQTAKRSFTFASTKGGIGDGDASDVSKPLSGRSLLQVQNGERIVVALPVSKPLSGRSLLQGRRHKSPLHTL